MEIEKMNSEEIEKRLLEIGVELDGENADIDALTEEVNALEARKKALKENAEKRMSLVNLIRNGDGTVVEKIENNVSEREARAKELVETGRIEMRTLLSSGKIATPTAIGGVNGMAAVASDIVDDVNAIPLTGNGAWIVAYQKKNAEADEVTDGNEVGGTASEYDKVSINPFEIGVTDEVSKQVKKMTPLNYLGAIETAALSALRAKVSDKIVANVKASALTEKKTGVALDADFLKTVILGFRATKTKGAVKLYLTQADLLALGKVRGSDKKAVYDIAFDEGTTTSGIIQESGMACQFRVLDQLTDGTQLFGQPLAIDMPMWDDYAVETDESGEFFKKNMICVRGLQTANADLVVFHGMQMITQA